MFRIIETIWENDQKYIFLLEEDFSCVTEPSRDGEGGNILFTIFFVDIETKTFRLIFKEKTLIF